MKKLFLFPLLCATLIQAQPPAPLPPVPTPEQLAWQRMELTLFLHFGVNTFSDREWGTGKEEPKIFKPSALDCRQWAQTAKAAGFKLLILTAKHHDGFCLWPTKLSDHCVRRAPWKNGQGDVVREFVDACRAEGLKVGLYLSPWDRNHPQYGSDAYNDYFTGQLTELLTNYGPVDEMWFDGACGEGPNGKKQVYDWPRYYATIRRLAPRALIAISGPDIRWVGNESGVARLGERSAQRGGTPRWYPAECDVSLRPGWFYHAHEDGKVKALAKLVEIYFASVGRNSSLLLNVPPDRRGLLAEPDVARLKDFGDAIRGLHAGRLAPQKLAASAERGPDFAADKAGDGNLDTYWSTDEATKTGWLELDFGAPRDFNVVNVQEAIALGERISRYRVDAEVGGAWQTLARGTTLGQRNLHPLARTTAQKLRLVIEEARACPAVAGFSAHLAPVTPPPLKVQEHVLPLTAHKPARASNVHGNNTNFGADKAVDDDEATRWATSDGTRECWLEVDLGQPESFRRVALKEMQPRITKFAVEYKTTADGAWQVAFSGGQAGANFSAPFAPVTARWVRLHILEATFAPTLWDFALYKE